MASKITFDHGTLYREIYEEVPPRLAQAIAQLVSAWNNDEEAVIAISPRHGAHIYAEASDGKHTYDAIGAIWACLGGSITATNELVR